MYLSCFRIDRLIVLSIFLLEQNCVDSRGHLTRISLIGGDEVNSMLPRFTSCSTIRLF